MVNTGAFRRGLVLVLAAALLTGGAWVRSAEYDEQYTLFLTAGTARPAWPQGVFPAGAIRAAQTGHASLAGIARALRSTDVHPPLYFWAAAAWRRLAGPSLFALRLFSVLCSLLALALVGSIAARAAVPPALAMLLTLGCYGFAYTGTVARGFALAALLLLAGVRLVQGGGRLGSCAAGALLGAASATNYLAALVGAAVVGWQWEAGHPRPARPGPSSKVLDGRSGAPFASWPGLTRPSTPERSGHVAAARALTGVDGRVRPGHDTEVRAQSAYVSADGPEATIAPVTMTRREALARAAWCTLGLAMWLPIDLWFFLAQRSSRTGQFPPFALPGALYRLASYAAAALFGGLPLYVPAVWRPLLAGALAAVLAGLLVLLLRRRHHIAATGAVPLFAVAAAAPPLGLMLLGAAFNTTPIEFRYLAFATPFVSLLLAGALARLPHPTARVVGGLVVAIQAAALAGWLGRPETMQPARAIAAAAVALVGPGVVLLPRGNDGVGMVGAFGIEAPAALPLLLVPADETPSALHRRIAGFHRVVLAMPDQDAASHAALRTMRAAVRQPCWRPVADRFNVAAFERVCEGEAQRCCSKASR